LLYNAYDEGELASCVNALFDQNELRDSLVVGGHEAVRQFSSEAHITSIMSLYDELLAACKLGTVPKKVTVA
jgi:hypothetical protein